MLLDAKRNDIGTTSDAYAHSCYNVYGADACTINAYFGIDGVRPFLKYKEKGIFVLVKTSNPSSGDLQNLFSVRLDDIPNTQTEIELKSIRLERTYLHMARYINDWSTDLERFSGYHNLGVVVGATYPNEMKKIRGIVRNSFVLIPGYGAQGAQAKDIKNGFNDAGLGGIVNSSRGIMFAYKNRNYPPEKFGDAAREEILEMNEKINKEIEL